MLLLLRPGWVLSTVYIPAILHNLPRASAVDINRALAPLDGGQGVYVPDIVSALAAAGICTAVEGYRALEALV